LLIPDDNSLLASNIRNNSVGGKFFSIPFSDLKFKPKLLEYQNDKRKHLDGFLVKNTNQVKKITDQEVRSPQTLTVKVRSQKKIRKKQ
jgi:hypothetical protein